VTTLSFNQLLKSSRVAMPAIGRDDAFIADRSIRIARPDRERLDGKIKMGRGKAGSGSARGLKLGKQLDALSKTKPRRFKLTGARATLVKPMEFDQRQRAVVKVHYFNHAGGGAAGLKAHAKYVARDAATRDDLSKAAADVNVETDRPQDARQARAHAAYLDRPGATAFYDAGADGIDGASRVEAWAKSDRRHFRLILSAEEGARLRDLSAYTREVMARAGAALDTRLSWVAVNHHDTDNPHTHVIVRGRRANGQDLVMPRDFIKHGLRSIARDVASEWLGKRTPEQERLALDSETRRHGLTRLDRMIAPQVGPDGIVKTAELQAPNGDATLAQALKARVRELERMGLGQDIGRGAVRLTADWRERLQSLEQHLDIRKRIVAERIERGWTQMQDLTRALRKGPMER